MVEVWCRYLGELEMEAVHGPSGTRMRTDAPVDNRGKGASFSPTDLVATALGTCIGTTVAIAASRHAISLEGMTVHVTKSMASDPRRIGALAVTMRVPATLDESARAIVRRAAEGCPVHRSLHPDVAVTVRYEWGGDAQAGATHPHEEQPRGGAIR